MTPPLTSLLFDVGTSGVKAILDNATRRVVASHSRPYGITTHANGWVDQDLDQILGAVDAATRELLAASGIDRKHVEGIGATAQMFNLVAVRSGWPIPRPDDQLA